MVYIYALSEQYGKRFLYRNLEFPRFLHIGAKWESLMGQRWLSDCE